MKIQGIFDTAVDPESARGRVIISPGAPGMPRGVAGSANAVKPVSPTAPPLTDYPKELERIAEAIRKYIHFSRTSVDITVDEELQQIVTRVLDEDSGKVIRQYPEDAALVVMKHLKELRGLLLHKKG